MSTPGRGGPIPTHGLREVGGPQRKSRWLLRKRMSVRLTKNSKCQSNPLSPPSSFSITECSKHHGTNTVFYLPSTAPVPLQRFLLACKTPCALGHSLTRVHLTRVGPGRALPRSFRTGGGRWRSCSSLCGESRGGEYRLRPHKSRSHQRAGILVTPRPQFHQHSYYSSFWVGFLSIATNIYN